MSSLSAGYLPGRRKLDTASNTNTPLTRNTPLTLMDNGLMQTTRLYRSVLKLERQLGKVLELGLRKRVERLQHHLSTIFQREAKNPLTDKAHHGLVPAIGVDSESLLPGVIEDLTAVSEHGLLTMTKMTIPTPGASFSHHFDVLTNLQIIIRTIRSIRYHFLSFPDEHNITMTPKSPAKSSSVGPGDPLTLIRRSALEVLTVLRELGERVRLPLIDDAYDAQSDGGKDTSSNEENGGLGLHEVDADTSVAFSFVRVQGKDKSVPVWEDLDADEAFSDDDEKEKRERWDERLVVGSGWLYKQDLTLRDVDKERKVVSEYVDIVDAVLFHGEKAEESGKRKERGWVKERRKLQNKGGKRRASAGDIGGKAKGLGIFMGDPGFGRRVSTGMLPSIMDGSALTSEPGSMGGIEEGDEDAEETELEPPGSPSTDDSSIDEEDLPEWARKHSYEGRDLDRVHALIHFLLPPAFHDALSPSIPSSPEPSEESSSSPSTSSSARTAFLDCLSSGQLLCLSYNAESIHDIFALAKVEQDSEKKQTGWTFRRTDNLRLWAGSLKLRYMLPIILPTHVLPIAPSTSSSSTGSRPGTPKLGTGSNANTPLTGNTPLSSPLPHGQRFNANEPPLLFDAKVVARKDEGWDGMLEAVLVRWMWRVVDERRGERV
ncbi:hypothetical protein K435DRAFT_819615 [Dendrothele bispora CBS 962.96]|uniref:Uncharacterized protein n=1 Tax=Dendrothele bispora (strain CBS 962.96) TaxID=1314807 RepID=A0A4S8M130_DENBC|nr:hypothetical protein K435DRAFT_819615 [Dendrothele bispora CBS 962.96]